VHDCQAAAPRVSKCCVVMGAATLSSDGYLSSCMLLLCSGLLQCVLLRLGAYHSAFLYLCLVRRRLCLLPQQMGGGRVCVGRGAQVMGVLSVDGGKLSILSCCKTAPLSSGAGTRHTSYVCGACCSAAASDPPRSSLRLGAVGSCMLVRVSAPRVRLRYSHRLAPNVRSSCRMSTRRGMAPSLCCVSYQALGCVAATA